MQIAVIRHHVAHLIGAKEPNANRARPFLGLVSIGYPSAVEQRTRPPREAEHFHPNNVTRLEFGRAGERFGTIVRLGAAALLGAAAVGVPAWHAGAERGYSLQSVKVNPHDATK